MIAWAIQASLYAAIGRIQVSTVEDVNLLAISVDGVLGEPDNTTVGLGYFDLMGTSLGVSMPIQTQFQITTGDAA
jgi:hypothetical protein